MNGYNDMKDVYTTDNIQMMIQNIIAHIENGSYSLDHRLQRRSKQWDNKRKGNFIRRLLHGHHIQPIHICTQIDEAGVVQTYIIDGKQRTSTAKEFMEDRFSISAATANPCITYSGVIYETKVVNGKKRLITKKNRETGLSEFVPIVDENGKPKRGVCTFDIRGAKFSQLPPELQVAFKEYNISIIQKRNCTDEEIQQEIIDFNSGMPMCVEQKGVTMLGVDWATKVSEIMDSYFIKNCCEFSWNDEKKSRIERRIVESLCLLYLEYKKNYEEMCKDVAENLTDLCLQDYMSILDDLRDVFGDNEELAKYIGGHRGREFSVIIGCYDYFRSEKSYSKKAFARFLTAWVDHMKDEKVIENDGEYVSYTKMYESGTTSPSSVNERIEEMNLRLDQFLEQHCEENKIDTEAEEVGTEEITEEMEGFIKEFCNSKLSDYVGENEQKALALRCLMALTPTQPLSFQSNDIRNFVRNKSGNREMQDDCLMYAEDLSAYLVCLSPEDVLCSIDNIPLLMWVMKEEFYDKERDTYFSKWLKAFSEECKAGSLVPHKNYNAQIENTNAAIISKKFIISESVANFFNGMRAA